MNNEEYWKELEIFIEKREEAKVKMIKAYIEKVQTIFPEMSFRCEYFIIKDTYILEVKPFSLFKNHQYVELQYDFRHEFEDAFPGYMIMFISDRSVVKLGKTIFEIGPRQIRTQPQKRPRVMPAYEPSYA